ncbi:hypothetical protein BCU22_017595 [Vibrio cyclitrophicus]|uniref:hypothetical protein n=1 Tax=Vibrio cyclitrophicus TaxID=47951 RepID=UPI000C815F96|nr:hypothetical protein [Vibrio cyclitrophicus]PMJ38182.1 hypothetical protein BCU22_17015 [Vibrio cyclitrophicus]
MPVLNNQNVLNFEVLTINPAARQTASKEFRLVDGRIESTANVTVNNGVWQRNPVKSWEELRAVVENNTLCSGVLSADVVSVWDDNKPMQIRTGDSNLKRNQLARTKREGLIGYPDTQGFLLIDYDGDTPLTADEIHALLCSICPNFIGAGYVAKPSSSAGIHYPTGEKHKADGWHLYYVVDSLAGIPNLVANLKRAAWGHGYGEIKVSAIGSRLERNQVFDASACDCSRFSFEAMPKLYDGITRNAPQSYVSDGAILSVAFESDVSREEYMALVGEAKDALAETAAAVRAAYMENKVSKYVASGMTREQATATVNKLMSNLEEGIVTEDLLVTIKTSSDATLQRKGIKRDATFRLGDLLDLVGDYHGKIVCYDSIHEVSDNLEIHPRTKTVRTYKYSGGKSWHILSQERHAMRESLKNKLSGSVTTRSQVHTKKETVTRDASNTGSEATAVEEATIRFVALNKPQVFNALFHIIPAMVTDAVLGSIQSAIYNLLEPEQAHVVMHAWLHGCNKDEYAAYPLVDKSNGYTTLKNVALDFTDNLDIPTGTHKLALDAERYADFKLAKMPRNVADATNELNKLSRKGVLVEEDAAYAVANAVCHALRKTVFTGGLSIETLALHLSLQLPQVDRAFLVATLRHFVKQQAQSVHSLVNLAPINNDWSVTGILGFDPVLFNLEDLGQREVTFVKAPMASGKTQAMVTHAQELMDAGLRVVIITHRERLSRNNALSFSKGQEATDLTDMMMRNLHHADLMGVEISDADYEAMDDWRSHNTVDESANIVVSYKDKWVRQAIQENDTHHMFKGLAVCINSAFNNMFNEFVMGADVIIIDEASQVLDSFTNRKTMGNQSRAIMNNLLAVLTRAPKVILLDAGLCERDVRQLVNLHSSSAESLAIIPKETVSVYEMPNEAVRFSPPKMRVIGTDSKMIQMLDTQVQMVVDGEADGRFMLACDSVSHVWNLRRSFIEMGVPAERVLCITSPKPEKVDVATELCGMSVKQWETDMKNFTAQPDKYAELYDIIIYSPAIDSGISLVGGHFKAMYGWFTGVIPAPSTLQMMRRLRTVDEILVYITAGAEAKPLDVDQQLTRDSSPVFRAIISDRIDRLNRLTALQASSICTVAETMGFTLEAVQQPTEVLTQMISTDKQHGEDSDVQLVLADPKQITDALVNAICQAEDIEYITARQYVKTDDCSYEDVLAARKAFVRDYNGMTIEDEVQTEHVLNFFNPKYRKALYNVELLSGTRKVELPAADDVRAPEMKRYELERGLMLRQLDTMVNTGLETEAKRLKKVSKATKKKDRYFLHHAQPWVQELVAFMWDSRLQLVTLGIAPASWIRPSTPKPSDEGVTRVVADVMKSIGHVMSRGNMDADEFNAWLDEAYSDNSGEIDRQNNALSANIISKFNRKCIISKPNLPPEAERVMVNRIKTMNNQRQLMTVATARQRARIKDNRDYDGLNLAITDVQLREYSTLDELKAIQAEQAEHEAQRANREALGQPVVYLLPTLVKPADVDLSKRAGDVGKGSENVAYTDIEAHAVEAHMFK